MLTLQPHYYIISLSRCLIGKTTFLSVLMDRAGYGTASGSVRLRLEAEDIGAGARSSYTVSELRCETLSPLIAPSQSCLII